MSVTDTSPLARFTVVEVNDRDVPQCLRIATSLAGKIAADLGADVLKIEPPGGDPIRHVPPSLPHGESALFQFLNTSKRSLMLDLADNDLPNALAEFRKAQTLSAQNSEAVSMVGYALARAGDRKGAQAVLAELLERGKQQYVPPFNVAMLYNGLGDTDDTFAWLEKAYADRDVRLTFLKIERKWDSLRSDERFASLAKRMALQ